MPVTAVIIGPFDAVVVSVTPVEFAGRPVEGEVSGEPEAGGDDGFPVRAIKAGPVYNVGAVIGIKQVITFDIDVYSADV